MCPRHSVCIPCVGSVENIDYLVSVGDKVCFMVCRKLQRQTPQLQQRQKAQPAAVQTVTITDSMTVRDLAVALHISPPELDSKLVELGEMLESEEDLYDLCR